MLGGASQIVSMIRVKCNGKRKLTELLNHRLQARPGLVQSERRGEDKELTPSTAGRDFLEDFW
jgi:hypothetical protein